MSTVLISFLGASNYKPVRYRLRKVTTGAEERYAPAAIVDCLGQEGQAVERAAVVVTEAARNMHWSALRDRLDQLGVEAGAVDIPDGSNDHELWQIFARLGEQVDPGETVIVDPTHGFRSLPVIGVLALAFFRHLRKAELGGVYYGAYEARAKHDGVAPIFDLTPMFDLPAWAEAVAEWDRTGRATGIVERTKPYLDALRRNLMQDAPRALVDLPDRLELLSDLMTLLKHDQIGTAARQVVDSIDEARSQAGDHLPLTPLVAVAEDLGRSLTSLAHREEADWRTSNPAYLRQQLAAARWLGRRGRVVEAYSLLRECITSCCVRLGHIAGLEHLRVRHPDESVKLVGPTDARYRTQVDHFIQSLAGVHGARERPRSIDPDAVETLHRTLEHNAHLLDQDAQLAELFAAAHAEVREQRNRLDHCWTGEEFTKQKLRKGELAQKTEQLLRALDAVRQLVEGVARAQRPEGPEIAVEHCFLNLSNHPVATWPSEQVEAARALQLGEPRDLEGGMPMVDPEADEQAVTDLARELINRAMALAPRGAYVAGEYSLTVQLIAELRARSVRCYTATSTREVTSSMGPDGAVTRHSRFRFVRWREYGRPPVRG